MTSFRIFSPFPEYPTQLEAMPHPSPVKTQLFTALLASAIEDLLDGILILTIHQELLYANDIAHKILSRLGSSGSPAEGLPQEILHICKALIQSRRLFPNQYWSMRSEVSINHSAALDVQVRWLNLESENESFLLLAIKDSRQLGQKIVGEEAQRYGLTLREKEIWLLHRANKTYKQIAVHLGITANTVKKHMASIHAKRKALAQPC